MAAKLQNSDKIEEELIHTKNNIETVFDLFWVLFLMSYVLE